MRDAAILAYVRQNSAVPGVVRELEQQSALRRAGHKVVVVDDLAKFEEALRTGTYDLVLADASDADTIEQQVRAAPIQAGFIARSVQVRRTRDRRRGKEVSPRFEDAEQSQSILGHH